MPTTSRSLAPQAPGNVKFAFVVEPVIVVVVFIVAFPIFVIVGVVDASDAIEFVFVLFVAVETVEEVMVEVVVFTVDRGVVVELASVVVD